MNKIEFSDINKFLTSLGLIIIGIAALLPWLINQNIDLITLEQDKINKTTETARMIIANQQYYLYWISLYLRHIVGALITLGLALLAFGVYRWKERQKIVDEIQNEELKSKQLLNITKEEKKAIIENEITENEPLAENKFTSAKEYMELENLVYLKLASRYKVNYETLQNIRIDRFSFDIILKSRFIEKRGDLIVEVKYFKKLPPNSKLKELINSFLIATNTYEDTQKRKTTPVILFIINELDDSSAEDQKTKLNEYVSEIRPSLRIKFIKKDKIQSLEATKLLEKEESSDKE